MNFKIGVRKTLFIDNKLLNIQILYTAHMHEAMSLLRVKQVHDGNT
jgi:hypothetical protein